MTMRNGNRAPDELIKPERLYNDEEVIDLREYIAIINKWRGVIALLTLCAVVTSAIVSYFILSPVYETKTVLMVAQSASTTAARTPASQDNLESLVNTISSIPQLTMNTYVAQVKNDKLMGQVAQAMRDKGITLSAGAIMGMVNVESLKDTNLIEIKASNTDPQLAAEVANTVQQEYLKFISANNQEQMKYSSEFLQKQILIEEENLNSASSQLQQFEGEPRNLSFLQKQMESKQADLSKFQSLVNQANYEYRQTLAGRDSLQKQIKSLSPFGGTTSNSSVDSADDSGEYLLNPAYASLRDALARKEMDLAEKAAQYDAAQSLVASLETDIRSLQAEISEKKLAVNRLTATLQQSQNTYDLLTEKRIQTQIMQAINVGESYLIPVSPAPVPGSPVKPNKKLNILIAGLLGLMLSAALAFLLEFLDNTIKDAEDIYQIFNRPVVGNIPLYEETSPKQA